MRPLKIISGGQTGVDRAALDVAIELGIPHGGWCPKGRKAEDGRIPGRYQLTEIPGTSYITRTRRNVDDGTCTLVIVRARATSPGTLRTIEYARAVRKPCYVASLGQPRHEVLGTVASMLRNYGQIVNIAGPRESKCPGIYEAAKAFLLEVLR